MANKIVQLHDEANNNIYPVTTLDAIHGSGALRADFVLKQGDTMTGPLTAPRFIGNADSATKLATARTISLTGDVTGSGTFDGSNNLSITATVADYSHNHNNYLPLTGGTMTGTIVTPGDDSVVIRPAKNNYDQIGSSSYKFWQIYATTFYGTLSGNASTATKLQTARTIRTNLSSTAAPSFDGTANITPGVTGTLDITNGGTGKTTKNAAYTNLLHQGQLSDATLNLKRGLYSYLANAANVPGSYGCVYNVIANEIDEGVAIGGTTSGSWVWQVAFDTSQTAPYIRNSVNAGAFNTWRRFWIQGDAVTGAVWNDYAECRESDCKEFGYVLMEVGDDSLTKTTERLSHFAGVSSDTWGFSQGETDKAKTPIAVAGRVLVYPYQDRNNYKPGDCVCAAPGGTVDIMTREEVINYPDRIVGTVSCVPDYEEWGGGENADRPSVKVNGRIWIKVK